jgi:hypothetical protein
MAAHAGERQCECHWGSAEELASLKVPDVELAPDLLRRTVWAMDWDDHASVLRRVLPQLATSMVAGDFDEDHDLAHLGEWFARSNWMQWSPDQTAAVWETVDHPLATQRLVDFVDDWGITLLSEDLPWPARYPMTSRSAS